MKPKHFILFFIFFGFSYTAEAQLFKKLKKKAEQAAERTILNKTDKIVTKKTEQAIDSATTAKTKDKKNSKKNTPQKQSSTKSTTTNNPKADLHLQNSVHPEFTELGGAVTFTIAVNNKGPETSKDIVSKIVVPSSYSITNISVTQGTYSQDTKLWDVGTLDAWKRAVMTVMVVVMDDKDLMTTGEIISCNTQDPDSTPNNGIDTDGDGEIIDDKDDEDDGDGQDVKIGKIVDGVSENDNGNNSGNSNGLVFNQDIKMVMEHKRDKIISYLDFDSMAMILEDHSRGKKNPPIYWDKDGYIYSGDDKGKYYKIPFDQVKKMGKNMVKMFSMGSEGMPVIVPKVGGKEVNLEFPNEPIIYNGYELHIYPNRYPMIEWVFIYHPKVFRGADNVIEDILDCRGNSGCTKFTVTGGVKEAGSTVLFDSKDRLAEITNPDGAKVIYTYEPSTVALPAAESFNFNFGN